MTLKDQLTADVKAAQKASDESRRNTLRLLLAAIQQAEIDKRPAGAMDEGEVLAVIQKEAKARREAIADAHQANRADLVAANESELHIIESYLPKQLSRDELAELARAAIAEAGATDPKHMGAVMKLLTPRTKGLADGKLVSEVVRELLSR